MRPVPTLALLAGLVLVAGRLPAADPPHWSGAALSIDCGSACHTLHQAGGSGLTQAASNVTLCQSCHNPSGLAGGLSLTDADKAAPGTRGTSHAFDVDAVNPAVGALAPQNTEMQLRVMGGKVVCSTCHNQHSSVSAFGGTSRIAPAKKVTAMASPLITSGGVFTGAQGRWYLLEITSGGAVGVARFRWSIDNGTTWLGSNVLTASTPVALNDGVTAAFPAGTYVVGERYEFSAAWPFLRATQGASGNALCLDCHRDWNMTHTAVETYDGTYKSHPVGVGLNANGSGYDRSAPLDGNGDPQGGSGDDANVTNDLRLFGGQVQCLTCHAVHHVDSNTQTVDQP